MLNAAIPASLVALRCPHCGVIQVRARKPKADHYECRECHRSFSAEEGREQELAQALLSGKRSVP